MFDFSYDLYSPINGFYWVTFAKQSIFLYNPDNLHFSSDHTVAKISRRQKFASGDLLHFQARILLRQKYLPLGSSGIVITISCSNNGHSTSISASVQMGHENPSSMVGQHLIDLQEKFFTKCQLNELSRSFLC